MQLLRAARVTLGAGILSACGAGAGEPPDAGDSSEPDASLDLGRAHWIHGPVYSDSSTSVSSPDLAIGEDGEVIAAWSEDVGGQIIRTEIFVAEGGPDFQARPVIAVAGTSATRPSIAIGASDVHLVAAADAGATHQDVFYARRAAGAWSAQKNLTGPSDSMAFVDHDPEVLEVEGETVVLYRSAVFSTMTLENSGLYMLRFTDPNAPGASIALLDRATFDCNDFEALGDGRAIHVVANCSEADGPTEIIYLTNKSGTFVSRKLTTPNATFPLSPDIALGDGGNAVHLIWNASTDCGGITCRDVFYSRDLATPVSVTGGEEDGGFFPNVTVDRLGRVIVVFHRLGNVDDVMWTYAESGTGFVRVLEATPGTPGSVDFLVGNLVINPTTDRPHMIYVHSLAGPGGSNPFQGELVR